MLWSISASNFQYYTEADDLLICGQYQYQFYTVTDELLFCGQYQPHTISIIQSDEFYLSSHKNPDLIMFELG